jgi:transposase
MAAREFNTTPTKISQVFDKYGQMVKLPLTEAICIDEFYWNRKSKTKYACAILDFNTGNIIDIINGRKIKDWDSYTQLLNKEELKKVKYICIDLYEPYRQVQQIYFPHATLCCDSFHVVKNINKLLKDERIKVMRRYDHDSIEYYLLKNFNYLLMMDSSKLHYNKGKYNKKLKRYINYPQILELILNIDSILKEAYELKELYLIFNAHSNLDNARSDLADIIKEYSSSHIEGYRKFSNTLIEWFNEIINSFTIYNNQRLSNGKIEGTNSRIKTILKNANGYKNFSRMRNRMMFSLNKGSLPTILEKRQQIKEPGKKRGKYKKHKTIK